ncbi:glycoside hydrolase [Russula dissimulans]|nr:glycoside hydrolase [Russula dissimulans]
MAENRPVSMVQSDYATAPPSLYPVENAPLDPPRASYFNPGPSINGSLRDSAAPSAIGLENDKEGLTPAHSTARLPVAADKDSEAAPWQPAPSSGPFYRRRTWLAIALGVLVALILVVIIPVYFTVIHKSNNGNQSKISNPGSGSAAGSSTGPGSPRPTKTPSNAISGGDGSTITMQGGTQFIYNNSFGGTWYYDPSDPFNNNAKPNSWTPPLTQSWDFLNDKIFGVNLGGWLVLEPFITPQLYQKYPTATDEWTLSQAMAADTGPSGGLESQMEAHYSTFITEQDIAQIAGAGLNWVRVPLPFWAIDVWAGEPFYARGCWKYFLLLLQWARKYGLRVLVDLHTIPGSQNGFNHSGKGGQINFLNGIMGIANAQRTLDYIRIITEFISQPEYQNLVGVFGIMNEPLMTTIGQDELISFYLQSHTMIRGITGIGAGNGPYIAIHDSFAGLSQWANVLPDSDRMILDTHPYFAFGGSTNTDPLTTDDGSGEPGGIWPKQACGWAGDMVTSQTAFGVTMSGEFSSAINECGLYVLGVGQDTTSGVCAPYIQWQTWPAAWKTGLLDFTLASMDSLQNWFFWTWKIGVDSVSNQVQSPAWSYSLGLANGWIPTDPRTASGKCKALGVGDPVFSGTYSSWQTGGAGAGTIAASETVLYPWPPTTISGLAGVVYANLPTYTPTGTVSTLPPPSITAAKVTEGNGWYDAKDTAGAMITVAGCTYPNAWDSAGAVAPTAPCPAGAAPLVTGVPAVTRTSAAATTTAA